MIALKTISPPLQLEQTVRCSRMISMGCVLPNPSGYGLRAFRLETNYLSPPIEDILLSDDPILICSANLTDSDKISFVRAFQKTLYHLRTTYEWSQGSKLLYTFFASRKMQMVESEVWTLSTLGRSNEQSDNAGYSLLSKENSALCFLNYRPSLCRSCWRQSFHPAISLMASLRDISNFAR